MLYHLYSVLLALIISSVFNNGVAVFKPAWLQKKWLVHTISLVSLYSQVGLAVAIFCIIQDMQTFADWLGHIIYVLQHLGVAL